MGRAIKGRRDQVVLATKFGNVIRQLADGKGYGIDGSPEYVKRACEASLRRLGVDDDRSLLPAPGGSRRRRSRRPSARWPSWCRQGKVRYLGLSEAAPETIRRAHAVHPIAALQTEYSLWSRDPEDELLAS